MDYVGVTEIPVKHILKRWTRDARDVLPDHLRHYQRDHVAGKNFTKRHSTLYIQAMELVRLGDTSAAAYEKLSGIFNKTLAVMAPFEDCRDGLGLEDRPTVSGKDSKRKADGCSVGESASVSGHLLAGMTTPSKKQKAGRPTSSRDRAPYEGCSKRTRFCSICKRPGHKKTSCPDRGDEPKLPRKAGRCSVCGVAGHRKSTCVKPLPV
jgi:hypothetical protein